MADQSKSAINSARETVLSQPDKLPVELALKKAALQIDQGQLQSAEALVRDVLQQQPGNPFAIHLLGVIAHQVGRTELGVELIGQAIAVLPRVAQFHRNRGEMYRILKQLDLAIEHGKRAATLAPDDAVAHSNLGIAYYDNGDFEKAEACQQRALAINPGLPQALNNLGSIHRENRDKEAAMACYRKVLALSPDYVEARSNLAAILTELGQPEEAIKELAQVVRSQPHYPEAHSNFGSAFMALEQHDKAKAAFAHALSLASDSLPAMLGMARVLKEQHSYDEAMNWVRRAMDLNPEKPEIHGLEGDVQLAAGRYPEAETAFHKALQINSDFSQAILGLGQLQLELGQLSEAQERFRQVMDIDPEAIVPHVLMGQARKLTRDDDPSFIRIQSEAQDIDEQPPTKAIPLHFALGRAYDDLKEYDKAFPHFLEGNRLKRTRTQYDPDNQDLVFRNIQNTFSQELIESLRGAGDDSESPIFVLGMPRSGTTLVETIIASHPDVYGAGELYELLNIANFPRETNDGRLYPNSMQGITPEEITAMGKRYINEVRAYAPKGTGRITDKMPANFLALGLIHLMLPRAKIIHIKRNSADTCLSNFTNMFNNSLHYSYNLDEVGRYYVGYANLMEHWRHVLPEDAFFEIQYEELVANQEEQTRRLINYCGLAWDDACLEHHKSKRSIKTASVTQVRQPVYSSSVERWRNYSDFLQPLMAALGSYAPE